MKMALKSMVAFFGLTWMFGLMPVNPSLGDDCPPLIDLQNEDVLGEISVNIANIASVNLSGSEHTATTIQDLIRAGISVEKIIAAQNSLSLFCEEQTKDPLEYYKKFLEESRIDKEERKRIENKTATISYEWIKFSDLGDCRNFDYLNAPRDLRDRLKPVADACNENHVGVVAVCHGVSTNPNCSLKTIHKSKCGVVGEELGPLYQCKPVIKLGEN